MSRLALSQKKKKEGSMIKKKKKTDPRIQYRTTTCWHILLNDVDMYDK